MNLKKTIIVLLALLTFTLIANNNDKCFKCHGMANFGYYKPVSTGIMFMNLGVPKDKFLKSNHGKQDCITCHSDSYEKYPHPKDNYKKLICIDCHKEERFEKLEFKKINNEFKASVHYNKNPELFDCASCHNPHTFKYTGETTDILNKVEYDNTLCTNCHLDNALYSQYTDKILSDLYLTHNFLPATDMHFEKVRCVECHTPKDELGIHTVLGKEKAITNCVECHSENSVLMTKLYNYSKDDDTLGFMNAALFEDSYVIGATRNVYLDYFFHIVKILTVLGVLIHGFLRKIKSPKKEGKVHEKLLYKSPVRIWHWINAVLFIVLMATGFSLHFSTQESQIMDFDIAIKTHNVLGILLTIAYIFYVLYSIKSKNILNYIPPKENFIKNLIIQTKFYLFGIFKGEPHPFEAKEGEKFNPLQRITYVGIMFFLFPILIVSGIMLMFPETAPDKILGFGGIWPVAVIHYITAVLFTAFLIGHIYLVSTGDKPWFGYVSMIDGKHREIENK